MSPRLVAGVLVLILSATCASASEQVWCDIIIFNAEAGTLSGYTDQALAGSLRTIASAVADAVDASDARGRAQRAHCITATRYLLREFERRGEARP